MNTFKEKLQSGQHLIGFEVDLCDPCISEMVGMLGYDYIWVDTEHEAMDYHTVLMQIIACRAGGTASVVRIPFNEPYLAKRVLEMGPDGIIFPMVSSAAEAKAAMDACLYPPMGKRGFGPRRACRYGAEDLFDYIREAPDRTCRFIQLEHVDGEQDIMTGERKCLKRKQTGYFYPMMPEKPLRKSLFAKPHPALTPSIILSLTAA